MQIIPTGDIKAVNQTFCYDRQTVVGPILSLVATAPMTHLMTTSWKAVETNSRAAYPALPFVPFIHKAADCLETPTATATVGASATSNAAFILSSEKGSWDVLGFLLSVTVLDMLLGAAIILPV